MIPAMTVGNLAIYSLQIAIVIAAAALTLRLVPVRSPRVRLACLRTVLIVCLALPFVAPLQTAGKAEGGRLKAGAVTTRLATGADGRAVVAPGFGAASDLFVTVTASKRRVISPLVTHEIAIGAAIVIALGAAARLAWLALGLIALRRLRRAALGAAHDDRGGFEGSILRAMDLVGAPADFLTSDAVQRPVTFGLRNPVVMLPATFASLDEDEQVAIACHELLHVRRRDWLHTVAEELVRALFWFHPAAWWLLGQVDLSREQVVDEQVVRLTEHRQPYVNALVRLALTPAGPILRPASLFLRRAHLLQRVALLSREVRMSRWRLAVSVMLVAAVLVGGGRLVVQAFPLAQAPAPAARVAAAPNPVTAPVPVPAPYVPSAPVPAAEPSPAPLLAVTGGTTLPPTSAQDQPPIVRSPDVLQRVEPVVPPTSGDPSADRIVVMTVTVGMFGTLDGPVEMSAGIGKNSMMKASNAGMVRQLIGGSMLSADADQAATMRAAWDAVEMWRFQPPAAPAQATIGFNFARTDQSGPDTAPVRIGGSIKQPARVKNVRPVYPQDAQMRGIQGVVILELAVDGAGIVNSAYVLRPIPLLTGPAVEAALQWRFEARPDTPRTIMTVTVNFTLSDPGVAGGVQGGVSGGVVNGVNGGVGAVMDQVPSNWPSNAIQVGGDIKPPTRIKDVRPVYPAVAAAARVRGVVILQALIGPDGTVTDVRILRSIPLLDQAAIDAVRQWRFTPTLLNGNPVPVIMTTTVAFDPDGGDAALASSPSASANGVYRPGNGITVPRPIREVKPQYTADAKRDKVEGTAVVECVVGPDGKVSDVKVIKTLDPRLDQAAVDAASQWEFTPGTRNGEAVPVLVAIEMMFTLR